MTRLRDLRAGDRVLRTFGSHPAMTLTTTEVGGGLIRCGPWTFDRETGAEVDEDLQWGPAFGRTGSYIEPAPDESSHS